LIILLRLFKRSRVPYRAGIVTLTMLTVTLRELGIFINGNQRAIKIQILVYKGINASVGKEAKKVAIV